MTFQIIQKFSAKSILTMRIADQWDSDQSSALNFFAPPSFISKVCTKSLEFLLAPIPPSHPAKRYLLCNLLWQLFRRSWPFETQLWTGKT